MFRIGKTPSVHDDETLELARRLAPSTFGHMIEHGFAHGVRPVTDAVRAVGTAFTVRIPDTDSVAVHYAVDRLLPGHVLVVDMGGDRQRASVGAMVAYTARERGASAIVVDGMATDLQDLRDFGLPVFAGGISPLTTSMRGIEGDINVPVSIGGAVVTPGQLVIADEDGVLFIDAADWDRLSERALLSQANEDALKVRLRSGVPLASQSGAEDLMSGRIVHV